MAIKPVTPDALGIAAFTLVTQLLVELERRKVFSPAQHRSFLEGAADALEAAQPGPLDPVTAQAVAAIRAAVPPADAT
jgi:hypothetical protein